MRFPPYAGRLTKGKTRVACRSEVDIHVMQLGSRTTDRLRSDCGPSVLRLVRYLYQTRHTYASLILTAGEDPSWIASQMGHADWGMIRKRCARWIPDARPEAGLKAAALWDEKGDTKGDKLLTKHAPK